ncbi:phospholipid-binding protein MlaC [Methylobacterium sp. J-092]|uniref:MlaC/ttg2D family ABC transporter substrate-binding protein n=1 Tax=Methylobacterium sp. J-092 TaxID=2836667 RepID=UPI0039192B4E
MRLMRRLILALTLVAGTVPAFAADDPAVAVVDGLYARFDAAVKNGAGTLKDRIDAVGPTLERSFDYPAMVRLAIGAKWAEFSPEQQGAITEAFRRNFVVTYANRLARAAGAKFEVTRKSEASGTNQRVLTHVTTPDGDDSQIDFVVNSDNRIQDVLLNGNVSEVAGQRASLGQPLKAGGADAVLKFLRERTDGMLNAKPAP